MRFYCLPYTQEKEKAEEAYGVSKRMLEDFTVPDVRI